MKDIEARELASQFGSRMCDENGDMHGEELYCFSLDDIIAIKEALAQPAAPEVWMFQHEETGSVTCIINDGINTPELFLEMNPRYTLIGSPNSLKRPWVGLTDEEANLLWENTDDRDSWELIRQVEAKLKDKNGA